MIDDFDHKQKRRDDAIYNPIEGKWEKRVNRRIDDTIPSNWENKLKLTELKTAINGLKRNEMEQTASQKSLKMNRKGYREAKKVDGLLLVKIAIALILLFMAGRT